MAKLNSKAALMLEKRILLRGQLWPDVDKSELWVRQDHDGFTTIPRTMPMLMSIMDKLSKGKPLGATYLALWCYVWDDCFVTIKDPRGMAYEVGFGGQRSEAAWNTRINILEELGFIKTKPTPSSKYGQVLILNPYKVVYKLYKSGKMQEAKFNALLARTQEVQADDLDKEIRAEAKATTSTKPKKKD